MRRESGNLSSLDDQCTGVEVIRECSKPRVGVVISTVGRAADLSNLLRDLAVQTTPPQAVAVCDQSNSDAIQAVVSEFSEELRIVVVRGPRGASAGRNSAAFAIAAMVDLLWFPNDTSRVLPDFISAIRTAWTPGTVLVTSYVDAAGPRHRFESGIGPITLRSVWTANEPACVVPSGEFMAVGGFCEAIGTGAATPWQSGESSELLLRLRTRLQQLRRPDLIVFGPTEDHSLSRGLVLWKRRAYGRGMGHVYRMHEYPLTERLLLVLAGLTVAVRKPARYSLLDTLYVTLGRVEGLLGRTLGGRVAAPVNVSTDQAPDSAAAATARRAPAGASR